MHDEFRQTPPSSLGQLTDVYQLGNGGGDVSANDVFASVVESPYCRAPPRSEDAPGLALHAAASAAIRCTVLMIFGCILPASILANLRNFKV